jgi:uncharacterized membrane protein YqjE
MSGATPLSSALRNLGLSAIGLAQTRIELLATEWEEERARLTRICIALAMMLCFVLLTIVAIGAFIVVAFWDSHRLLALGMVGGSFALGAVVSGLIAASALARKPRLFAGTLAALDADRVAITGQREVGRVA